MAAFEITWNESAIKASCELPGGQIDRGMRRIADMAVLRMKFLCPTAPHDRPGPTPGHPRQVARRSGTLRSSIAHEREPDGSYLIGARDQVGPPWSAPQYLGPLIERGTRPHPITSHGPWPLYSTATRTAYGHSVNHPGTRAQPFVRPAARSLDGVTIHI